MSGDASKACCFCVDSKSEAVIFGHLDGSLSKYSLSSAAAMGQIRKHTEAITQLAWKDSSVLSCSEDGFVYKYDINALDDVEMLQRLSASIRTIHISTDGRYFLIAGDQMDLCIVNYAEPIEMDQLEGHQHKIICGRFDSTSSRVATLSSDNSCIIWRFNSNTGKWSNEHKIDVIVKESKRINSSPSLSWNPSQLSMVAIPNDKSVLLYDVAEKSQINSLAIPKLKGHVHQLSFSPNGNYLCICSEQQIFIYNFCIKNLYLLKEFENKLIIGISWLNEELCYLGFDNCSFEGIPISASNDLLAIDANEPPAKKQAKSYDEDSLEDLIEKMAQDDNKGEESDQGGGADEYSIEKPGLISNYYNAQQSFMPNCTPFILNYRFLAWNNLGLVHCRQDDSKSKIDVDFFEAEKYRPIRFIDTNGLSMASLGSKGVLFASEYFDESNPSVVKFIPYESWAPNSDWTLVVPGEDSICLIAMAKKWAVLFFTSNKIAIYSLNGILKIEFMWPCVRPISMSAFENELLFFWLSESGATMYSLLDLNTNQLIHSAVFSCRSTSSISWIGYSETGIPLCYTDNGLLYGLMRGCYYAWTLLLDCHKNRSVKNENFWPISVTFDNILLYAPCYGGETFPNPSVKTRTVLELHLLPQPTISLSDTESNLLLLQITRDFHSLPNGLQLDEERQSFVEGVDYHIDKQLLELIMVALTANKQSKAIELVTLLSLESSYQKAIRLCQHYKFHDLADKVDLIRERTFQSEHSHENSSPHTNSQMVLFENDSHSVNQASSTTPNSPPIRSPLKPVLQTNHCDKSSSTLLPQSFIPKSKNPFQR